ncbi:MAG: ARMT1-like domain-containing protein [Chloroflexi bacterium]|nr:ARMT1-like domain-containing protein [Chloroflexota bacterium]
MRTPLEPPPPIRTDHSNAFANNTMRVRLPAIIDETLALNPDYALSIRRRLAQLRDEIASGDVIRPLDIESAPDHAAWSRAIERQREIVYGDLTWHNAEWFFAETYAYRCLIEGARRREGGRAPVLPVKQEELNSDALWQLVERALAPAGSVEDALRQTVAFDLWANRIDLSYAASLEKGTDISPEDWLVDDRDALLACLCASSNGNIASGGIVTIIADNAGSELAMDLVLADCLLRHAVDRVIICLKWHPTFVSDATTQDVWSMLAEMGKRAPELAERLISAWNAEELRFLPHPYWNSSRFLSDLPGGIQRLLERACLVIIKGDANYRRAVADCVWPAHTPFADVLSYLDVPVLCLRTLKSDPVVGLPRAETAAQLDRDDPQWRVNGKRGLAQFKP